MKTHTRALRWHLSMLGRLESTAGSLGVAVKSLERTAYSVGFFLVRGSVPVGCRSAGVLLFCIATYCATRT